MIYKPTSKPSNHLNVAERSLCFIFLLLLSLLRLHLSISYTMRRASTLASSLFSRTLATAHGGAASSSAVQSRLLQAALYGSSTGNTEFRRRWFSSLFGSFTGTRTQVASVGVAGALVAVVAATSFSQEVYAKEPPSPEVLPKEVVLYQYEACPFCNKVKGN